MYKDLAEKLTSARNNVKLSRKQVAEQLGISYTVIAHYECGERVPSLKILASLARLYKVSADYLLDINTPSDNTISLDGLSSKQKEVVKGTVNCFRDTTHG